jgi:hypothetical protein
MTRDQKIIKMKVGGVGAGAGEAVWGNVARACRIMGYSRDSFYRFKELLAAQSARIPFVCVTSNDGTGIIRVPPNNDLQATRLERRAPEAEC